eukprot:scaffold3025_cov59-Phaeocystis_antarctica.AAC.2
MTTFGQTRSMCSHRMLHTRQQFCDACSLATCIAPAKPRQGTRSAPDGRLAPVDNLGIAIRGQLEALEVEADADHVEGIVVHQPAVSHVRPAGSTPETSASAAPEHGQSTPQAAPSYSQPWSISPGAQLCPGVVRALLSTEAAACPGRPRSS